MSLVGTRPILPDELEQYELHHRARIAIKPGITGMWQVSGRSDITDFEEIVRLDTEYISEWNIGLDSHLGNIPWLARLGQNSLGIYIINSYVNLYILKHICENGSENLLLSCLLAIPVTVICLVATVCISRNKLLNRLLLGGR